MSALSSPLVLAITGSDATKIVLVAIFAIGMLLVVLVPFVLDIYNAHRNWRTIVSQHPETLQQLPGPNGIQGLARATMAVALIVAIAFGLGYVLVEQPFTDNKTIVSNILVALTTALASITAFYFGNRAATESQQTPPTPSGTTTPGRPGGPQPNAQLAVTITRPADGESFTLGQVANADYSAAPAPGAQISLLKGPVESGSPIDTSMAGSREFTVVAKDSAGNEAQATSTYVVTPG